MTSGLWRVSLLLVGALLLMLAGECGKRPLPESTIAEVNGEAITVAEFTKEFLTRPKFHPTSKGTQAVQEQYAQMVAERLLAQEAQRRRLHRDRRLEQRLRWVMDQAMREQLYREHVKAQVVVTDAELRQAFVRRHTIVHLRQVVVPTEEEAWRLRARLEAGETFEEVANMLPAQTGHALAVRWGELDPDLEAAAYCLKVGELSIPVKTAWGYHVIRVEDVSKQALLSEEDFQGERRTLERILRARKEDRVARAYAAGLLQGVQARVSGELFALLVNTARAAVTDTLPRLPARLPALRDEELGKVSSALGERMDEPFVSMGDRRWTLGDFLRLVGAMPLQERPHMHNPARFRQELQDLIRDQLLTEEARRQGLAKHPEVKAEVERWRRILLAARMRSLLTDTLTLRDEELHHYYQQRQLHYRLSEPLEQLSPQVVAIVRDDAWRAKADSVVDCFVAQLRRRATIRQNMAAYQWAFQEVGGHNASFIKVLPVKP